MNSALTSRYKLTISVIIPVHNGGENFDTCLRSISEAVPQPNEIIVVADGGKDGFKSPAKELCIKFLETPLVCGPGRARNLGAGTAKGDILFFIDADVAIPPDAIHNIASVFINEPELSAVIGSYDDGPAATNFLSQYKNLFHHYVHQSAREEASTFWGACGAIRREVFLALGGFEERNRQPAIEDIELGYRLKGAGHQIRLCKKLQVKHLKHWKVASLLKSDYFHRALPWTELILRDRCFINDLNLKMSSRLSVMLTYGLPMVLVGAWWWRGSLVVAGVLISLLLALNAPLYCFFLRKRGLWFALRTIPWHWFYYFYSGLAFAIGVVQYLFNRRRSPTPGLPKRNLVRKWVKRAQVN